MSASTSQQFVWGKWKLNPNNACLEIDNGAYQVPVDEMTDSASILDWIFQISEKTWATSEDVGNLAKAISDILGRGVCGGGINHPIDPKPSLRRYGVNI